VFFQICFTYECIIKIFALGLVGHRLSYLRDPWNTFDFIILVSGCVALTSLINLTYHGAKDALLALESTSQLTKGIKPLAISQTRSDSTRSVRHLFTWRRWIALNNVTDQTSVFSVLRVLRPLRILRMFPELRRLTGAVSMAVPQLINLASLVSPSYSPTHSRLE
jgi:hypothetical protein